MFLLQIMKQSSEEASMSLEKYLFSSFLLSKG